MSSGIRRAVKRLLDEEDLTGYFVYNRPVKGHRRPCKGHLGLEGLRMVF